MSYLSVNPYKGTRDFYPEDKRIQNYLFQTMRRVVQSYGYEEYDAPLIEDLSLYLAKSGEEIANEQTYTFIDRGGRKVAIRPEMTPSVSRMVARRRQELTYPLRLYSIPNLWRYERQQKGRFREHWQLNVDLFGLDSIQADNEIINIADDIWQSFGAKRSMYQFKINSRKFIDHVLSQYLKLTKDQTVKISRLIDRFNKMSITDFINQVDELISDQQRSFSVPEKLIEIIKTTNLTKLPKALLDIDEIKPIKELLELNSTNITNMAFDGTIMRGFDYYTDIIFEVFDTNPDNNRSMMGGGRYDGLVGLFGVDPLPTVGFGLGDATLLNFILGHGLLPEITSGIQVYVVHVGQIWQNTRGIIKELRSLGVNVAESNPDRKVSDQISIAVKKKIPYVLIIGEEELKSGDFTLKNLASSKEVKNDIRNLARIILEK